MVLSAAMEEAKTGVTAKDTKKPSDPTAYHPICLLDTTGKILERIVCDRLEKHRESTWPGRKTLWVQESKSTLEAIKSVVDTSRDAIVDNRWKKGSKKYCIIETLDVKMLSTLSEVAAHSGSVMRVG